MYANSVLGANNGKGLAIQNIQSTEEEILRVGFSMNFKSTEKIKTRSNQRKKNKTKMERVSDISTGEVTST